MEVGWGACSAHPVQYGAVQYSTHVRTQHAVTISPSLLSVQYPTYSAVRTAQCSTVQYTVRTVVQYSTVPKKVECVPSRQGSTVRTQHTVQYSTYPTVLQNSAYSTVRTMCCDLRLQCGAEASASVASMRASAGVSLTAAFACSTQSNGTFMLPNARACVNVVRARTQ